MSPSSLPRSPMPLGSFHLFIGNVVSYSVVHFPSYIISFFLSLFLCFFLLFLSLILSFYRPFYLPFNLFFYLSISVFLSFFLSLFLSFFHSFFLSSPHTISRSKKLTFGEFEDDPIFLFVLGFHLGGGCILPQPVAFIACCCSCSCCNFFY